MELNRRKLLKASGASLASSAVPIAAVGNAAATSEENYLGQAYHTASHEAQGRVDARLQTDAKNRLRGRIKIP